MDRKLYKKYMQSEIFTYPNLHTRAGSVFDVLFDERQEGTTTRGPTAEVRGVQLGTSPNKLLSQDS